MNFEIKCSKAVIEKKEDYKVGCTIGADEEPNTVCPFNTMEEALKELKEYTTYIWEVDDGFKVHEFYVEENVFVGAGEWVPTGKILAFARLAVEDYE